jgi:hypothetical protein
MIFRHSPTATGGPRWLGPNSTLRDARFAVYRPVLETRPGSASADLPMPACPAFRGEGRALQALGWALTLLALLIASAGLASVVLAFHEATYPPTIQEPLGDLFYGPIP